MKKVAKLIRYLLAGEPIDSTATVEYIQINPQQVLIRTRRGSDVIHTVAQVIPSPTKGPVAAHQPEHASGSGA